MSSQSSLYNPTERTLAATGDGFSVPRLTTAGRTAIALTPSDKGMMVYDTTLTTLCLWNGTAWEFIGDNSNGWLSVKDFGAVGDGTTDDTAAINAACTAAGTSGATLLVPAGTYLISSTITLKSNLFCQGEFRTAAGFSAVAVDFSNPGYGVKRVVTTLTVRPTNARVAGSVGIQVDFPNISLNECVVSAMDYGMIIKSYSVMLTNCASVLCNTNLSAYAPSQTSEINHFTIIGGNYDSAVQYAMRIGDPRFATTVPAGEAFGYDINITSAAFDGAVATFDRVSDLVIQSCYFEGPISSNKAIDLGGAGNNLLRTVEIANCYFQNVSYPIYCNNSILNLVVRPNRYGGNPICALYYVNTDVSPFEYYAGVTTNPFTGPEVHTGFTYTTAAALTFAGVTISSDFLYNGVQLALNSTATNNWYPYGLTKYGQTQLASATGRFHNTAVVAIPGSMAGNNFTCTNISDALKFNGGDRVTTSFGGTAFVRSVDYIAGVIVCDGVGAGAGTISLNGTAYFRTISVFGTAAPASGTYNQGDIVYNANATSGGYVGWVCTVAGTPGTWRTFGLIS
jgi:hypothetical protein